ncbi:type IV pilus assembly protein PilC [Desulfohalotomaculum tongense]|uniref:type II secretion system F family protein n=1 Tax=Desulforadius tongensis TaxID=1216062 RepID=UPI00195E80EB|nr:type IV pilus assembly protein PilC [Desulforadius tongensis]
MLQEFLYRARDVNGQEVTGIIRAEEIMAAANRLRKQNLYITKLEPAWGDTKNKYNNSGFFDRFNAKVRVKELAVFCRQLSTLLAAGVPVLSALNVLAGQTGNKYFQKALAEVINKLQSGHDMAEALKSFPSVFPAIFISMVEVGEMNGEMDRTFALLAGYFEKEDAVKESIKTALIYPVIILFFSVVMIVTLMLFILPIFVEILKEFNMELPAVTKMVISFSRYIVHYWYLFLLVPVGIIWGWSVLIKNYHFKKMVDGLVLRLPILGPLLIRIIIARFSRSLADLIRTGVPLLQALDVSRKIISNTVISRVIENVRNNVRQGGTMAEELKKSTVFPLMVTQMIVIGEKSGAVYQMLDKIADFYERELDVSLARLPAILEPVLITVTGGIVSLIVLAMVLPMFNMLGSVNY